MLRYWIQEPIKGRSAACAPAAADSWPNSVNSLLQTSTNLACELLSMESQAELFARSKQLKIADASLP